MTKTLLAVLIVSVTVLGCSGSAEVGPPPSPPSGFPAAFAERDCGPTDGSAVVIYLVNTLMDGHSPPYPHLRVAIWRPAADVGGQTFRWRGEDESTGVVVRCSEAGMCQRATSVTVRFRAREPDGAIPGYLDLEFDDGVSIRGGFRAAWRHRPVYCG